MTSNRYLLTNKNSRRFRYSNGYLTSKSLSVKKLNEYLDETGGNDADCDEDLEDIEDNLDEYDYDNSHEFIEYDKLTKMRNICFHKHSSPNTIDIKLDMTTTSAYDTCSNLSNEITNSCSRSTTSSGSANECRISSGNASGDFNFNDEFVSLNHEVNAEPDVQNRSSATAENQVLLTVGVDETSTTNTDVSDPHWDGYTSSPYYSNSVTVEDICVIEKAQPVLPWDELFFELDPIEDHVPVKLNVS